MLVDKQNIYSQDQAVTVTADSTNSIDHGQTNPNLGAGSEGLLWLVIVTTAAVTAAGAATVVFDFQDSADNVTFASLGLITAAIGKATLVAGYAVAKWQMPVTTRRYTKIVYTVATGPLTAGTFSAFLTNTPDAFFAYPRGYTITGA